MVLSKRERYIAVLTISVLLVLGLYQFVLQPLRDQSDDLDMRTATAAQDFSRLNRTVKLSREARTELKALTDTKNGGKLSTDASAAETLIYRNVRDWAQEAGMSPPSVQPTRAPEKEKDFYKLTFRTQGSGSMAQISRFLFKIRTATVPVQINELQITSNKENTDDLKLNLVMSTIYLAPETTKPGTPMARAGEVMP